MSPWGGGGSPKKRMSTFSLILTMPESKHSFFGRSSLISHISHIFLWNINTQSIKHVFGGLICIFISSNRSSLRHSGLLQPISEIFTWSSLTPITQDYYYLLMQLKTIQYLTKNHQNCQIYQNLFVNVFRIDCLKVPDIVNGLNAGAKYPTYTIPKGGTSKVWRHFQDGQYLGNKFDDKCYWPHGKNSLFL